MLKCFSRLVLVFTLLVNSIPYPALISGNGYDISALQRTSTAPVLFKNENKFENAVGSIPLLAMADDRTYILPGMESTLSLNDKQIPSLCGHMVPQGICVTDAYVLVTAYCHNHEHNSVLYVLDKNSRQYIKTVVLEGKPHAGSICWDPIWRHVWISTGYTNHASASYLRIREIEKYDFSKTPIPLSFTHSENLPELTRNSFMTWNDGCLYAGTFTLDEPSMRIQKFQISTAGHLKKNKGEQTPVIMESMLVGSECQGIALDDNYIYLTFSYGPYRPSTLCVYKRSQKRYLKSDAIRTFTLPPCLEQPYVEDGVLYLMWESAAQPFRNEQILSIDRIMMVDVEKMMHEK